MIVYNVLREWFPMKNDAETYRRSQGLKADALFKLEIHDRDELAALLNGLVGLKGDEPAPAPAAVLERNVIEAPDFVPKFLAEDWAKRHGKELKWVK